MLETSPVGVREGILWRWALSTADSRARSRPPDRRPACRSAPQLPSLISSSGLGNPYATAGQSGGEAASGGGAEVGATG